MNTDKNNTQLPQSSVSVSAFLTGKAKQDFEKWLEIQEVAPYKVMFWDIPKIVQVAYIVEWLDSIGLFIDCGYYAKGKMCSGIESEKFSFISTGTKHETRKDAFISSIQKASELYNAKVVEAEH